MGGAAIPRSYYKNYKSKTCSFSKDRTIRWKEKIIAESIKIVCQVVVEHLATRKIGLATEQVML